MRNPFRYFKTSPETIRLAVMMYVRFPLSLRNVEDLLHERGIDITHETVRFWWNRFGPLFARSIRRRRGWRQTNGKPSLQTRGGSPSGRERVLDGAENRYVSPLFPEADIQHHRKTNDLGRSLEISERVMHHKTLRNQANPLKPFFF